MNKADWNNFFNNDNYVYGNEPSVFLQEYVNELKKGTALELACSEGKDSVFLGQNGFKVEALDFSDVAINKAKQRAEKNNINIDFKLQDLDFYLAPIQKYDSIITIDFKLSSRLLDELRKGLVIGGTLLIEAYTTDHLKNNPNVDIDIAWCYKPFELASLVKSWGLVYYSEIIKNNTYKVRAILKKLPY